VSTETAASASLRAAITAHRDAIEEILGRYHASNPRLIGSVARGEATTTSDIELLVDLDPAGGAALLRVAGLSEELSDLLGARVDVLAPPRLRDEVSRTALQDAVAV